MSAFIRHLPHVERGFDAAHGARSLVSYVRIESILAALEDADHEARGTGEMRGTPRVGKSSSFVLREIFPRLSDFLRRYAAPKIGLVTNDRYQDLVTEGIDVAFRLGALPDPSAMARKIMPLPKVPVASPDYVRERGAPTTSSDLAHHWVIIGPAHSSRTFSLRKDGCVKSVRVASQLAITISEGATASAVAGLGIAVSNENSVRAKLATGRLVRTLPEFRLDGSQCTLYRRKDHKACRRAFADFLARGLRPSRGESVRPSGAPESVSVRPNQ
ncbi:substrate binding domain-containing protein [Bradyrhizobium guangdongense]|uniref:substrate binding domain-containing protein n=1 Tax=Bradyrhizobium guangdongense TaxID=1325090 RepID=UPI00131A3CAC|nr:substrate binding domain-containing protein [Bradyrhizobium guangdongense]